MSTLVPLSNAYIYADAPGSTDPTRPFEIGIPISAATSPNLISSQFAEDTFTGLTISPPPGKTLTAGHDYGNGVPSGGTVNMGFGIHGSTGSSQLAEPVVGLLPAPDGTGYWLAARDGGVFAFDEPFDGSLGGQGLAGITAIAC